jgi:hypothetical protein
MYEVVVSVCARVDTRLSVGVKLMYFHLVMILYLAMVGLSIRADRQSSEDPNVVTVM